MPFNYLNPEGLYKEIKELKKEHIVQLQDWLAKQPHLPPIHESLLIFFLHSCYYSIEQSKITIEKHYTSKTMAREVFGKINQEDFQKCFNQGHYFPLSAVTPEGYNVLICKNNSNPSEFVFYHHIKYIDRLMKVWCMERAPAPGHIMVLDMAGLLLGHILRIPLGLIGALMIYFQEGLPARLKGIHVINVSPIFDKALAIVKPFMKDELWKIIHIHNEVSSLYKYVPKEILPKDYGGNEDSVEELINTNIKRMQDKADFFDLDESFWTDESKRQDKSTNMNSMYGIEGSFKKLELD